MVISKLSQKNFYFLCNLS